MARPSEYVLILKPLWTALRVFGAWPQRISKSGRLVRSRLASLLTAAAFAASCWRGWMGLRERYAWNRDMPPGDFPLRLLNIQFTLYHSSLLIIALMILETGRLARYAERWHDFQPQLQRVCGRALRCDTLRRRVKYTTLALGVGWPFAINVPLLYAGDQSHMTLAETVYLSYASTVLALASTTWRMHCAFLLHAAELLVDALAESLRQCTATGAVRSRSSPASRREGRDLAAFMKAWLQLRKLSHDGANAVGLTTFANITILTLSLVLCTYNTMYILLHGVSKLSVFLTCVGILTGITISRIFNAAHIVNAELGTRTLLVLTNVQRSQCTKETLQEIDLFRFILSVNPVRLNILGYLPINRRVLGALWVTMSTYLVVLVQVTVDR